MPKKAKPRIEWRGDTVETELGDGWMVVERFELQNGRRVVAELKVCPAPRPADSGAREGRRFGERPTDVPTPAGGVKARLLRKIPVGRKTDVFEDFVDWHASQQGDEAAERLQQIARQWGWRGRRRARRSYDDEYWATLSQAYVGSLRHERPVVRLAEKLKLPISQVRSHINLARRKGFLSATGKGAYGGELTDKAKVVLAKA